MPSSAHATSTLTNHPSPELPQPPPRVTRTQSAWRAARDLVGDSVDIVRQATRWGFADTRFVDATARAYVAMSRRMARRLIRRLDAERAERAERLARRESLAARLNDLEALARLPENTLGHQYVRYLDRFEIPPIDHLLESIEIEARATRYGWTDEERWVVRRVFEEHDLWHVLCSYGASPAGEWYLNAFSYPSLGNRTTFVFGFFAPLLVRPEGGWRACMAGLFAAWRRGQRCDLFARDYATMLDWDLDRVRAAVGLPPFDEVHPNGIIEVVQRD